MVKANIFSGTPQVLEPGKCKEWKWFDVHNIPTNININLDRLIQTKYWKELFN